MEQSFPIITPKEFPGGVLCGMCERELLPGQPYSQLLDAMQGEDTVVIIICVYC